MYVIRKTLKKENISIKPNEISINNIRYTDGTIIVAENCFTKSNF